MFHTNLQSIVWERHVGAHADGHQNGGRKSMKTSGIYFCYKKQSDHSHEQVDIHINTSRKTSTVQTKKSQDEAFLSRGVKFRNPKWSFLKTAAAIELKTFSKIYIKDVLYPVKDNNSGVCNSGF